MKSLKIFFITLIFILPLFLIAQPSKQDSILFKKVDSIITLNRTMYKEQKNNPLEKYKYGIEFNPFRLLFVVDNTSFSGTFSMFDVNRNAELAFPFYYSYYFLGNELIEYSSDIHYRYFLGNTQNGFYISALVRLTILNGTTFSNNDFLKNPSSQGLKEETIVKPGIGFGIGVRIFSYKGFYWGSSLSFGKYISNQNNYFLNGFTYFSGDNEYIYDFEALKFGWAF